MLCNETELQFPNGTESFNKAIAIYDDSIVREQIERKLLLLESHILKSLYFSPILLGFIHYCLSLYSYTWGFFQSLGFP